MNEVVIGAANVSKHFGRMTAVDNVSVQIRQGEIYGLIGRNGAGKTTLLRMLAGLSRPSEGRVYIAGKNDQPLHVGCLIEMPGIYTNLSGRDNLELKRKALGIQDKTLSDQLLEMVGLRVYARMKTRAYSLGMRQRLGLAMAMMGDPDILILDEPANGLDPQGIAELRRLILKIHEEKGTTMIISSHQLDELSKVANVFGIMDNGRLLEETTEEKMRNSLMASVRIMAEPIDEAKAVLNEREIFGYQVEGSTIILLEKMDQVDDILRTMLERGIHVISCLPQYDSLEDYFLKVVKEAEYHE